MTAQRLDRDAHVRHRQTKEDTRIRELMQLGRGFGHFNTELSRAFPSTHGCP